MMSESFKTVIKENNCRHAVILLPHADILLSRLLTQPSKDGFCILLGTN